MNRGLLELHFHCAKCRQELELEYEYKLEGNTQSTKATQTTGAAKVEGKFYIVPCRSCLEPLDRITNALKTMDEFRASNEEM